MTFDRFHRISFWDVNVTRHIFTSVRILWSEESRRLSTTTLMTWYTSKLLRVQCILSVLFVDWKLSNWIARRQRQEDSGSSWDSNNISNHYEVNLSLVISSHVILYVSRITGESSLYSSGLTRTSVRRTWLEVQCGWANQHRKCLSIEKYMSELQFSVKYWCDELNSVEKVSSHGLCPYERISLRTDICQ